MRESVKCLHCGLTQWRRAGERIALVPTMGNLHAGHLELARRAREDADRVVVSIFVNPLQFGAGEDFDNYPRTLAEDSAQLMRVGTDLLFAPMVAEVYPRPPEEQARVTVPGLSDILCGASRPGHFTGVATVVCKLFNMVLPHLAVFGEKDFQQLVVIRRMAADLNFDIDIVGGPIVREADGLAMSSRNTYLSGAQREAAGALYQALAEARGLAAAGTRDAGRLIAAAQKIISARPEARVDYISIVSPDTLEAVDPVDRPARMALAVKIGRTRLIDNMALWPQ